MKPATFPALRTTRLLNQIRELVCNKHYSLRTEQAYVQWVRLFAKWHGLRPLEAWGCRKSRFFRSCWPISDGFLAFSWMAAQGRNRPSPIRLSGQPISGNPAATQACSKSSHTHQPISLPLRRTCHMRSIYGDRSAWGSFWHRSSRLLTCTDPARQLDL